MESHVVTEHQDEMLAGIEECVFSLHWNHEYVLQLKMTKRTWMTWNQVITRKNQMTMTTVKMRNDDTRNVLKHLCLDTEDCTWSLGLTWSRWSIGSDHDSFT